MSARPNPYRDVKPFYQVRLGGQLLKSLLVAINGVKIEDDWNVQKGTNTSFATAVFRGTKLVDGLELTLEGPDEETFDDLQTIWDLLAPVPTHGSAGPKPPTLQIENAIVNWIGVTAINRRSWEGPLPAEGNSWHVKLGLIQSRPSAPAGTGAQDPAKWANVGKGGSSTDPETAALQAQQKALAAQAAAV